MANVSMKNLVLDHTRVTWRTHCTGITNRIGRLYQTTTEQQFSKDDLVIPARSHGDIERHTAGNGQAVL